MEPDFYEQFLAWAQQRGYMNTSPSDVDRMAIMHVAALMRGDDEWFANNPVRLAVVSNG